MFKRIHHKILPPSKLISRSPLRRGFCLIPLALGWFALPPTTRAQLPSPTPDGGYPNQNTAEGTSALFSLTTGFNNTAIGSGALFGNNTGYKNTATGASALQHNTTGNFNTANGFNTLVSNASGNSNTASGAFALEQIQPAITIPPVAYRRSLPIAPATPTRPKV
jgi:hypothetical protein